MVAELQRVPVLEVDVRSEAYAVKALGAGLMFLSVFLEHHADGAPHLHAITKTARSWAWNPVREYLASKGVQVAAPGLRDEW